ncbi:hypothetical protein CPC16_011700 [Podila verticillata]|nr:hypothetical protein CPC16_011700 [Podila verticillata]
MPYLLAYSHNLGTLIYVLTILRGESIGAFDDKELRTLENWQTVLVVVAFVGHAFRDILVAWMAVLTEQIVLAGISSISVLASWISVSPTSTWTGLLGYPADVWFCLAFYCLVYRVLEIRIAGEERMLKDHFQMEWDVYASKRWKWIPLMY